MISQNLSGLIAVVRTKVVGEGRMIVQSLVGGGVGNIEVTMTSPDAIELIREFSASAIRLGAGTVLNPDQCQVAIDSGAKFIVSPITDPEVLEVAHHSDTAYIGGAMTPAEVSRAMTLGVDLVKIFPISAVGGATYAKTLREPFPQLKLIVSGGVGVADFNSYIDAEVEGVCVGGGLIDRRALANGDLKGMIRHVSAVRDQFDSLVLARSKGPLNDNAAPQTGD